MFQVFVYQILVLKNHFYALKTNNQCLGKIHNRLKHIGVVNSEREVIFVFLTHQNAGRRFLFVL